MGIINCESVWLVSVMKKGFIIKFLLNVLINFVELVKVLLIISVMFSSNIRLVNYSIVFILLV